MSQNNNSRPGRLPASVYRRRRITVLGLAVVVLALFTVGIVLLAQGLTKNTAGPGEPQAQAESGNEQGQGGQEGESDGSGESGESGESGGSGDQPAGPGPDESSGKCPTEAVEISAKTDKPSYKPNSVIKLELGVTNKHNASCAIDVGPQKQTFTVKKDKDTVWSSAFCVSGQQKDQTQVFVSGANKKSVLPWDMIPTDDKCNRTNDTLDPGEYTLVTKLGDIESQPAKFVVEKPAEKKPEGADKSQGEDKSEGEKKTQGN